jgi:hypothetical protein
VRACVLCCVYVTCVCVCVGACTYAPLPSYVWRGARSRRARGGHRARDDLRVAALLGMLLVLCARDLRSQCYDGDLFGVHVKECIALDAVDEFDVSTVCSSGMVLQR